MKVLYSFSEVGEYNINKPLTLYLPNRKEEKSDLVKNNKKLICYGQVKAKDMFFFF